MSASDDFPTVAAAAELVGRGPLQVELRTVLAEVDDLRVRHQAAGRIEALRARARAAEDLVTVLVRACRDGATAEQRRAAVAAHDVWLAGERVA